MQTVFTLFFTHQKFSWFWFRDIYYGQPQTSLEEMMCFVENTNSALYFLFVVLCRNSSRTWFIHWICIKFEAWSKYNL